MALTTSGCAPSRDGPRLQHRLGDVVWRTDDTGIPSPLPFPHHPPHARSKAAPRRAPPEADAPSMAHTPSSALTRLVCRGRRVQGYVSPWIMADFGWQYAYYFYPGLILAWCFLWNKYASNNPAEDPLCTPEEEAYIKEKGVPDEGIDPLAAEKEPQTEFTAQVYIVLLKQKPVYIFCICQVIQGLVGGFTSWIPQYLETQGEMPLRTHRPFPSPNPPSP